MKLDALSTDRPVHIPILLPNDSAALGEMTPQPMLMLSAAYDTNPRLEAFVRRARDFATTLIVDPKTPYFQFEGYMSMPDYRALAYSPGRHTLGTLWQPARFTRVDARRQLIEEVFAVERALGADLLLAPYFYVPHPEHPWLESCRLFATEAIAAGNGQPVGVPICVDIDALIDPAHRETFAAAYRDLDASMFLVTIVNYDERLADPRDVDAVMTFLGMLQETDVPVVLSHVGRTGLLAIARGAAGYASGTHGLESHPRSFFREMMGSRPANSYYLHQCFIHLAVRAAEACLRLDTPLGHPACDCVACAGAPVVTRMVSRRLSLHALARRSVEVSELGNVAPDSRCAYLIDRFTEALQCASEMAGALEANGSGRIPDGEYHYLEILREAAGGPAATLPTDTDDEYD